MKDLPRCDWCEKDELYRHYHDTVWGVPEYDPIQLFACLNLEGAQAGLSWYSVLKRMSGYETAFAQWQPEKIVSFGDKEITSLMQNPGIIRNRLKIEAVISNARAYLTITEKESFKDYIWRFTDGRTIVNHFNSVAELPASTPLSEKMSQDLRQRGFKFVGPTIVYAFMQAVGMVDDHLSYCWKRKDY